MVSSDVRVTVLCTDSRNKGGVVFKRLTIVMGVVAVLAVGVPAQVSFAGACTIDLSGITTYVAGPLGVYAEVSAYGTCPTTQQATHVAVCLGAGAGVPTCMEATGSEISGNHREAYAVATTPCEQNSTWLATAGVSGDDPRDARTASTQQFVPCYIGPIG
jgi:hypothetical protein